MPFLQEKRFVFKDRSFDAAHLGRLDAWGAQLEQHGSAGALRFLNGAGQSQLRLYIRKADDFPLIQVSKALQR